MYSQRGTVCYRSGVQRCPKVLFIIFGEKYRGQTGATHLPDIMSRGPQFLENNPVVGVKATS